MSEEKTYTGGDYNLVLKEGEVAEQLRDLADQIEKLGRPPFGMGICFLWVDDDGTKWHSSGFAPMDGQWIQIVVNFFNEMFQTYFKNRKSIESKQTMN